MPWTREEKNTLGHYLSGNTHTVGLAFDHLVRIPLLLLTINRVGISQLKQKNNKQVSKIYNC